VFFIVAAVLAIAASVEHTKATVAQRTASVAQSNAMAADDRARIRSAEAQRARAEANAAAMKDHADRVQAAKDLAAANAQFARARALANYNRTITIARDDPAAAVIAYGKEIRDLENGVGTQADLAFAYYARGAAYARQHQNDRARADFEHALRLKSDYTDAAAAIRTIASAPQAAHVVAQAPRAAAVAATPAPASSRAPSPRPSTAPSRGNTNTPAPPIAGSANTPACSRALTQQQRAARTTISPIGAYDASIAGLAENARCDDAAKHVVNEAYLRSTLAAAEHELNLGNWLTDLKRANDLLARCETMPALRGTSVATDCTAQRRFNESAAAQWSPQSAPTSPLPSPSPKPAASALPKPSPSPTPIRR
jgi:tetratricopeptide (TPR) repeat protein